MTARTRLLTVGISVLAWAGPGSAEARAQLSGPCQVRCALALGASSGALATGTMTVVGRLKGGYSTTGQAITSWTAGFVAAAGAGMALAGDGERQRRAIYGSALGAAGGALAGLALESMIGESDTASRFAAALIGSGLGVVAGGTIGALTHDGAGQPSASLTLVGPTLSLPWGW